MRRPTTVLIVIAIAVVGVALFLRSEGDPGTPGSSTTTELADDTSTTPPSGGASTTQPAPTTTLEIVTLPEGVAACDLYGNVEATGTVGSSDLVEASGLAISRTTPGVLWSHNDSRGGPVLYAFGPDGSSLGDFELPDAFALDWEDIAAGPGPDGSGSYLYVGDMGDNFGIRGGDVNIWRVPDLDPASMDGSFPESVGTTLTLPDGPYDAEALFVDPVDRRLFIATKSAEVTFVFATDLSLAQEVREMELVATLFLDAEVSGADMSPDGGLIAFRGYRTVWMWNRLPGESVADALSRTPCEAPSPDEQQGEAIAIDDAWGYFTVSEGENQPVNHVGANL